MKEKSLLIIITKILLAAVIFVEVGIIIISGGKLIGMSIAYIASFLGLIFAWWNYRNCRRVSASSG